MQKKYEYNETNCNLSFIIYIGSPRTLGKAYNEASKALKSMEEMTFSDAEIDSFLPKELRKFHIERES